MNHGSYFASRISRTGPSRPDSNSGESAWNFVMLVFVSRWSRRQPLVPDQPVRPEVGDLDLQFVAPSRRWPVSSTRNGSVQATPNSGCR